MKRHMIVCVCALLCTCLLTGCWDYRRMDEINIVAGVAVDKNDDGRYELAFELVDVASLKEGKHTQALVVIAEGATIFEAVRNAKKRLYNKLYFGSMRVILIGQDLARESGVMDIVDGFLRDIEPRETIFLAVSQENSAKEIIMAEELDTFSVSYEIAKIIEEDQKVDSTSKSVQLFEAYNDIQAKGLELVLPAFHIVENNDKVVPEINGIAVFRGDKLAGFLSPEDTHYFLMTMADESGGVLSLPYPGTENEMISVEIMTCINKPDIRYSGDLVSIFVTVDMDCKVVEFPNRKRLAGHALDELKQALETVAAGRITRVFHETQKNLGLDIYGFGNKVYEDQYPVWLDIGDRWAALYQNADFQVKVNATVVDLGITS